MQGLTRKLLTVLVTFTFLCQGTGLDSLPLQAQTKADTLRPAMSVLSANHITPQILIPKETGIRTDSITTKQSSAGNATYALSVSGIDRAINKYKNTPAISVQLESLSTKLRLVAAAVVAIPDIKFPGSVEDFPIIEYDQGGLFSRTVKYEEEFFRTILRRKGYSQADIDNALELIELYGSYPTEELAIEGIGEALTYLSVYSEIISGINEVFPGVIIAPTTSTRYKDTRINGDDANRAAALDMHEGNGTYFEVAAPQEKDADKLFYQYLVLSVVVSSENMPGELKRELEDAETEKDVKKVIVKYLKENFDSPNISIEPEQRRSHNLKDTDTINIVRADFESAIAAYNPEDGTILAQVHFWIKDNPLALELMNKRIRRSLEKPSVEIPKTWYIDVLLNISDSEKALEALAQNAWILFKEFSEGNFAKADLLAEIINRINPGILINPEGISIDTDLGIFISQKDNKADIPGLGEHLKEFLASLNSTRQLAELLYLLVTPEFDGYAGKGVCIDNDKLKKALIKFYYRLYAHIDEMSIRQFDDITVFEPLRIGLGAFVNALNKTVRHDDAIKVNGAQADEIITHLASKGIDLTETETENIRAVYNLYKHKGGIWAYDFLQMQELLTESHFVDAFYHLKVGVLKDVLPSEKPNLVLDASGRISRMALALRFCSDMDAREPGYIGRYAIRTREIGYENRLTGARATVKKMFSDSVIETASLYIPTGEDGQPVLLTELIRSGRLEFNARRSIISAKQDFVQGEAIECVCPVDVNLDGQHAATIYVIESNIFEGGLKDKISMPDNMNIPRPFIVQEEDGSDIYFGMMVDATPGGVYIGDGKIENHDAIGGKPTVWSLAATKRLEIASKKIIDARKELDRLQEILLQIEKERFLPDEERFFCYVKAQITKKLLLPLGGGIHMLGRFIHKMPKVKDTGAIFLTPTSCSTNGASYFAQAASTLFGFGRKRLTLIGTTAHMYTSGKDAQPYNPFGHFSAQGTGAAEGVKQHFDIMALFTSLRTPTRLKDGKTGVVGGSVFDFLLKLPFPAQKEVFNSFLKRIEQEFPRRIVTFSEEDKADGRYAWENTNSGQKTGSIVYTSSIKHLTGEVLSAKVAYDNEMSFSVKMDQGLKAISLARKRQMDKAKRAEVITKASSAGISFLTEDLERIDFAADKDAASLIKSFLAGENITINLAISIGGHKVTVNLVDSSGKLLLEKSVDIKWREVLGISPNTPDFWNKSNSDRFMDMITEKIQEALQISGYNIGDLQKIGIAFPGPVDSEKGIAGVPFAAPNTPFKNYFILEQLRLKIAERFNRQAIDFELLNDCDAAVRGELSIKGGLYTYRTGSVMIIGGGINIASAKNGNTYFGNDNEIREIGHNLVPTDILPAQYQPSLGAYTYTGFVTKGDHPKYDSGENLFGDFEDRSSGPNLAKRFAYELMQISEQNKSEIKLFNNLLAKHISTDFKDADAFLKLLIREDELTEEEEKLRSKAVDTFLIALTDLARSGNNLAVKWIKDTGDEIGRALAAFIASYQNEDFIRHIILVSGVNENLGKGVVSLSGEDIYIEAIQRAVKDELFLKYGVDTEEAALLAKGIERSKLTYEREFIAFTPKVSKASSAGISLTDRDVEHINLAAEIANLSDATGTVIYNDTSLSLKQQQMFQGLIGKGTPGLAELEAKLGCSVKLMSQGNIIDNANVIIISNKRLSDFKNAKYFIIEQTQIGTSHIEVAPLIAIAKGLLGLENRTEQPELYAALKSSIRSLSRGLLSNKDIETAIITYINGNPMFIKLPPAVSYDYDQLEQLQRQAIMRLIAA